MLIGYARVSTAEQNLDLQKDALDKAGCERIFTDHISGAKADRPGLTEAFNYVREGDTLVVWRLDRLGRSLKDLIEWVNNLNQKGIQLKSLTEMIDTNSPMGEFTFHLFGSLAQLERRWIQDRTMAGLAAARARGKIGGRPKKFSENQRAHALELHQKEIPIDKIIEITGISRTTLYRIVNKGTTAPESP